MKSEDKLGAEGEALLNTVEYADGKPIVISRFGFRVLKVGGQNFVVAATPDELAVQIAKQEGRSEVEVLAEVKGRTEQPACGGTGPFDCYPYNGCKKCTPKYLGNGVYDCRCSGT